MFRTVIALVAALSVLLLPSTSALAADSADAAETSALSPEEAAEAQFLDLINEARTAIGVGELVVNDELTEIARAWSAQMRENGEMSHNPDYSEQYSGDGILSENVGHFNWPAGELTDMVGIMHEAFMDSPAHRRNIERERFNQVGIGVVHVDGQLWVTVNFLDGPFPAELHDAAPAADVVAATYHGRR